MTKDYIDPRIRVVFARNSRNSEEVLAGLAAAYEGDAGSTDYDHTSGPPADAPDPSGPEDGA